MTVNATHNFVKRILNVIRKVVRLLSLSDYTKTATQTMDLGEIAFSKDKRVGVHAKLGQYLIQLRQLILSAWLDNNHDLHMRALSTNHISTIPAPSRLT